jgi:triosephosphate isomerase (TIM)
MARQQIAAGNWKMNTTPEEGEILAEHISNAERDRGTLVILAVPFTHIYQISKTIQAAENVKLAAQNCHHKASGAYTGEISPQMLTAMGVEYVIIGHSERRAYNGEGNDLLALKTKAALDAGLKVIFCCGEELGIRKSGNHISYVEGQLEEALFEFSHEVLKDIIIAYEPVWAIGTGETATPEQAQEMHFAIRKKIASRFGRDIADGMPVLYGGSVKASNAKEIFAKPDVDGGLVGGASLEVNEFVSIINSF